MKKITILYNIILDKKFNLAFFSILSAITSKLKIQLLYRLFSKKRYDECISFLKAEIIVKSTDASSIDLDNQGYKNIIWTMWYQGYDNAPKIVRDAIDSKRRYSGNHKVVVLDKNNLDNYVFIPDTIKRKVELNIISLAHLSDYVRVELLRKYGGLWIDSTIFLVDYIPEFVFEREFWSIHWQDNREWVASNDKWSVGVLAAKPNSPIMNFCSTCEKQYWERMNYPITYLLLDLFIFIFYQKNANFKSIIDSIEVNNTYIFNFVDINSNNGNKIFDEDTYLRYRRDTWLFQLTYKTKYVYMINNNKTYYGRIIDDSISKKDCFKKNH